MPGHSSADRYFSGALPLIHLRREERELADALEQERRQARNTWIPVNGTRVYLNPEALAEGELRAADADVMSDPCEGCREDILRSGTAKGGPVVPRVVCDCGAEYAIERA